MGLLTRMEKTVEHWESALVDKVLGNDPVELCDDLRRECDGHAVVAAHDRVLVPNAYKVELAPAVHEQLGEREAQIGQELTDVLARHAAEHRYEWAGPLTVHVTRAEEPLDGRYRISSQAMPNIPADAFSGTPPAAPRTTASGT
ncbi:DUF3662 domain-containing protein [Streptomyces rimosus]|uniref:DUF3662 domain-containing protein n=1 Tax=Streptomyces rimosus TaxID=1927 RepID=UPI00067B72A5|nr:DUF3662 domain-containing protein [Streptomyces rimosus]